MQNSYTKLITEVKANTVQWRDDMWRMPRISSRIIAFSSSFSVPLLPSDYFQNVLPLRRFSLMMGVICNAIKTNAFLRFVPTRHYNNWIPLSNFIKTKFYYNICDLMNLLERRLDVLKIIFDGYLMAAPTSFEYSVITQNSVLSTFEAVKISWKITEIPVIVGLFKLTIVINVINKINLLFLL